MCQMNLIGYCPIFIAELELAVIREVVREGGPRISRGEIQKWVHVLEGLADLVILMAPEGRMLDGRPGWMNLPQVKESGDREFRRSRLRS